MYLKEDSIGMIGRMSICICRRRAKLYWCFNARGTCKTHNARPRNNNMASTLPAYTEDVKTVLMADRVYIYIYSR